MGIAGCAEVQIEAERLVEIGCASEFEPFEGQAGEV